MGYKLIITPEAEEDLDEIYDYILKRFLAPQAAENTMTNIRLAIEKVLEIPDLGIDVSNRVGRVFSKKHKLRMQIAGNYLIFYISDARIQEIAVLRVTYQRRDWISLFK